MDSLSGQWCFKLLTVLILGTVSAQRTSCRTQHGTDGVCVSVAECVDRRPEVGQYIGNATCGAPQICCQNVLQEGARVRVKRGTCSSADGMEGTCIPIYNCPLVVYLLGKPKPHSEEDTDYVIKSRCPSSGKNVYVCCATRRAAVDFNPQARLREIPEPLISPDLLPDPRKCGREALGDKIVGGENTTVEQFPWMARIGYRSPRNNTFYQCGGALINNRYILTAAHCLNGAILRDVGVPVTVRLGEWITTTHPDCDARGDCVDNVVDYDIESTHPYLGWDDLASTNDIGLVRLASTVKYTEFIKPICLQTRDLSAAPGFSATLKYAVAGWGRTGLNEYPSIIKQFVLLPHYQIDSCAEKYARLYNRILNHKSQVCAGGEAGKDACNGDSGGPLMLNTNNVWTVEAVVSFGPSDCGTPDTPGIYTKVAYYLPWIAGVLRP